MLGLFYHARLPIAKKDRCAIGGEHADGKSGLRRHDGVGLGQRRSDNVKKMLVLLGAREAQIESVSLGEEKPKEPGHTEEAWARNRRSDMLYAGEY